MYLNDSDRIKL